MQVDKMVCKGAAGCACYDRCDQGVSISTAALLRETNGLGDERVFWHWEDREAHDAQNLVPTTRGALW